MKLSDFDYSLPKELIAQYPLMERDEARLLVINRKTIKIEHSFFRNIISYLQPGDLLVFNDSKVLPAHLIGYRLTGGRVEILLIRHEAGLSFEALIKPSRVKLKEKIFFNGGRIFAEVSAKNKITFFCQDINEIYKIGMMPLPPYIKRDVQELDNVYYQTVYAQELGSIAAPTAGLHFTKDLMQEIGSAGIDIAYITLHISYSTFKPVKVEDITKHKLELEYFKVPHQTTELIKKTHFHKGNIMSVGTTSLRALETYALGVQEGYTDLFIYLGYKFKIIDCLLTNFHLPRTTLFMLVCAFAGKKLIKRAYQEAIDRKYRFLSFGDAMLIV